MNLLPLKCVDQAHCAWQENASTVSDVARPTAFSVPKKEKSVLLVVGEHE
jgi:hypothetical protein